MNALLQFLVCGVFFQFSLSDETIYRAGIVENFHIGQDVNYFNVIQKAGENNVDILILPSTQSSTKKLRESKKYDEVIKSLSQAAKDAHIYVVAPLMDRVKCANESEVFENSLVFDRNGRVVAIFRNAISGLSKCNSTIEKTITFQTDFGVHYTLLSVEDIVLMNPESLAKDAKNFIASGNWDSELLFFFSSEFLSSWSSRIGANLLIGSGIYSGKEAKSISVDSNTRLLSATLNRQPGLGNTDTTPVQFTQVKINQHKDLSQYTIRTLNLDDTNSGHKETVCHGQFCCQFFVKTSGSDQNEVSSYSLAVFSGVHQFGSSHHIGVQNCAVIACTGLYKRSCSVGSSNDTSGATFENIIITGNFSTENSIQYPTALTTAVAPLSNKDFTFGRKNANGKNQITIKLEKSTDLLVFSIFGREFSKDTETLSAESLTNDNNIYDYIFNDELSEFVDYLWIRLRILIFVVSIYVLEMM